MRGIQLIFNLGNARARERPRVRISPSAAITRPGCG